MACRLLWPYGGLGLWRMYASLVLNELTWKHGIHATRKNILKVSNIRNHQHQHQHLESYNPCLPTWLSLVEPNAFPVED